MAFIVNIETATQVCSAALAQDGKVLVSKEEHIPQSHASLLTSFIKQVVEEANLQLKELDAVAISAGPGSYTGIRIGISVAKGLCYGLQCPLIKVNTLQAMANGAKMRLKANLTADTYFVPMIDARRMEVFTAIFDKDLKEIKSSHPKVIDKTIFAEYSQKLYFFGTGAPKCSPFINSPKDTLLEPFSCSASHMATLSGESFNAQRFEALDKIKADYFKSFYTKSKLI